MTGKVTKQQHAAIKAKRSEAKPAATQAAKPAPTPQLNERTLRRTGKASGFTKSFTPLPSTSGAPVQSDAPVLRASSAATLQHLRGGEMPTNPADIQAAEGRVANNSGNTRPWSMAELKQNPKAFLKNVVQLDGLLSSSADRTACGETALLMGMIASNPSSLQQLASKLVDANGNFTAVGQGFASRLNTPGAADEVREALVNLSAGKAFTASDVTLFANAMQATETSAGSGADNLERFAKQIAGLGVKVPAMELQLFGTTDKTMGHWRVVAGGTQFNPWPNDKGQSDQLPAAKGLAAGMSDGKGWVLRESLHVGGQK